MSATWIRRFFSAGAALLATFAMAQAGTITITWDPVTDSDLAGYKVYWGTTAGSYVQSTDVGKVTSATLSGLDACTKYYVAVKAYDTGGLESTTYSNEISGLPRPVVASISPATVEQGATVTFTVTGESFATGAVADLGTGVTVSAVRVTSCNQLQVDAKVDIAAAAGARDVTAQNADRTFGTRATALTVTVHAAPVVTASAPASGATNVAIAVKPTATFSAAMDATSVTSATVQLLDATGAVVAQAAGSPALSADKLTATVTPAAALKYSSKYAVKVVGGTAGVKDTFGKTMAADWTPAAAFTTGAAPDTTPPTVSSTTPADGATGTATTVQPQVVFSEAVMATSITTATVQLLDEAGNALPQAAGSPSLSADHTTVTIVPATALAQNAKYRVQVVGGSTGVKDEAGNALAATWSQVTPWTTQNAAPATVGNTRRTDVR